MKQRIEHLRAVHSARKGYDAKAHLFPPEILKGLRDADVPVDHPVVRIHPDTGRRALYVSEAYTTHILGLPPDESAALLLHLQNQYKIPENQLRVSWQPNQVTIWDNRAVVHYGVTDYSEPRLLERVTVVGTRPTGPGEALQPQRLPPLA